MTSTAAARAYDERAIDQIMAEAEALAELKTLTTKWLERQLLARLMTRLRVPRNLP